MPRKWYALNVRSRFESLVSEHLHVKGYDVFYPTYKATHRWSDRNKTFQYPLFPTYLFCSFEVEKRLPILIMPGVLAVAGAGRVPTAVEDAEIEAIRLIVQSGASYQPHPYLAVGERVRIVEGPLCGLTGLITQTKSNFRLVLSVDLLMRSVAVEIDESSVEHARESARLAG
jgi:transcription antitermination factor NusG